MNAQDLTSAVVFGYTSWKWYHEWKDRKKKERKKKERFQAKRRKHKARNRSFEQFCKEVRLTGLTSELRSL